MRRMFASLLQLVNAGNVGLQRPGLEGLSNSPVQLQLLSLELQHTQMLGFKAPSLHDKVPHLVLVTESRSFGFKYRNKWFSILACLIPEKATRGATGTKSGDFNEKEERSRRDSNLGPLA